MVDLVWGRRIPQVYLEKFTSLCKKRRAKQIIDAGCGSGLYTAYFSLQGFNVTAIDISRTGLPLAKHLVKSLHFLKLTNVISAEPSKVDFINGELPHFPIAENKAKAIFVNYTLHQLTNTEMIACIAELNRILKDRGLLLIHEPCGDTVFETNETIQVLKDGSLFLKKYKLINWNLTRDKLSTIMEDNFKIINEERLEENGKPKIIFLLEKS
jgi:malonyl-CoA O-methyltransferase